MGNCGNYIVGPSPYLQLFLPIPHINCCLCRPFSDFDPQPNMSQGFLWIRQPAAETQLRLELILSLDALQEGPTSNYATGNVRTGMGCFTVSGPWEKDIPFVGHISVYIYKMPHPMWTHTYLEEEWVQDGAIRLVVRFWRLKRSTRSLETELQNTEFICHVVFHLFQTTASQTKAWNLKHLETNLLRQHPNVYYSVRLTKRKAYNIA